MSDYEYEYGSDDEWPDQNEDLDEDEVKVENTFYQAEDVMHEEPNQAIDMFKNIIDLEGDKSKNEKQWTFKSLVNLVVLLCQTKNYQEIPNFHKELLSMMDVVTRNEATDAINKILDVTQELEDQNIAMQIYEMTLNQLGKSQERMWFNTSIKLAKLCLEKNQIDRVTQIIQDLQASCKMENGEDDPKKAQQLLETYALEIQLCVNTNNTKLMKEIYSKTTNLTAAVQDPRIMGVIKESGAKMYMAEKKWPEALSEFFDAFKNYQEVGNSRAKSTLKYVVLASILSNSKINPFHSQEANVFRDDPEIIAMTSLRTAYESNAIQEIQEVLHNPANHILDDPYIVQHLDELLHSVRLQSLQIRIKAYRNVSIKFLADQLNIQESECNTLLCELISQDLVQAKIDAVNGYLEVSAREDDKACKAIFKWQEALNNLMNTLVERVKL